ncbi:MAG: T9SS type A sorting domain-containing protein, partial [Ignavibacteria bacterium]|nr:T9SS type A sorting domain-containing protein [Ignavibacteria bacterium]
IYTGNNLDTAYNYLGQNFGLKKFAGYKNISPNSFVHYMSSHPTQGDPGTRFQARNYMHGFNRDGQIVNPCTFPYGSVLGGVNCALVNPRFMYSGDPVTNFGWINNSPTDNRYMFNTGPFSLELNKPIDIIVAYIVGRGTNAINSVHIGRWFVQNAFDEYRSNFGTTTGIEDEDNTATIPNEFKLFQNYPNPFNPSTVISFQLSAFSHVTLKVYDILGREVATLVNEELDTGIHHSPFSIFNSQLPSGIYFYQLRAGEYVETKKMIIIK